jgi:hypothetical protein
MPVTPLENYDEAKEPVDKAAFARKDVVGPQPFVAQVAGPEVCLVDSLYPRGRSNCRRWRSSLEEKRPRNEGEVTITESVFDPTYTQDELQTAEYWEEVILDAQAERLLKRMDEGRIEPPGAWTYR